MVDARQIRAVVTSQTLFPFTEYFYSANLLPEPRSQAGGFSSGKARIT